MSAGSILVLISLFYLTLAQRVNPFRAHRERGTHRTFRVGLVCGFLVVPYLVFNFLLQNPAGGSLIPLRNQPLYWVPLVAWLHHSKFAPRQLALPLALTGIAASVSGLMGLFQIFGSSGIGVGFFGNPIYYAYSLFPAFLFFCEVWRRNWTFGFFKPVHSLLVASAVLLGIFSAETRMIWLLSGLYVLWVATPILLKRMGTKATLGIAAAWLLLAFAVYQQSPRVRDKIGRSFDPTVEDVSWKYRKVAWSFNWELIKKNPLFGVGPERNYIEVGEHPELAGHWDPGAHIFAHSIYIQALADSGIVGFALMIGFFASLALCFPSTQTYLIFVLASGLTENIFNNARARHPFLFFLLLMTLAHNSWRFAELRKVNET